MVSEAWTKRIQNTIAESTRSIVPASDGIATLQSTTCTYTHTNNQRVINIRKIIIIARRSTLQVDLRSIPPNLII